MKIANLIKQTLIVVLLTLRLSAYTQVINSGDGSVNYYDKIIRQPDTSRYLHIGIIPYQILSRSTGIYIGMDLKKKSALEYRLTYTCATKFVYYAGGDDNYFFQGINNTFLYIHHLTDGFALGFMALQKSWWYDTQWVAVDINSPAGTSLEQLKSTKLFGVGAGLELMSNLNTKPERKTDILLFVNISGTEFFGRSNIYARRGFGGNPNEVYPKSENVTLFHPILTFGFKLGFRKAL